MIYDLSYQHGLLKRRDKAAILIYLAWGTDYLGRGPVQKSVYSWQSGQNAECVGV